MEVSDNTIKLAFSMQSNKGVYALLLGSGISISAGIPTGWGVVCDLINKLARLHGENPGEKCWEWYEKKFDKPADYSDLLDFLADTPTQRAKLLTSYFEPNDEEKKSGKKLPTPAHKAIAKLIEQKFVKVIITTNFDRLLEKALSDLNINPRVVSSSDDIEGLPSLVHMERPLIIKVNGDYLDSRIKNTPEELENYTSEMNQLLTEIFLKYGLILSGWSGKYDTALIECYKNGINKEFSTYWVDPGGLSDSASELLSLRDGKFVKATSDEFFSDLEHKLMNNEVQETKETYEVRNNLPEDLSSFIGRKKEIDEIKSILEDKRLITILGIGGSGKTRLVIEAAKRNTDKFTDGICFVSLSDISEKIQLVQSISTFLNVQGDSEKSPTELIIDHISDKKMLLILDSCELVSSSLAKISERFLENCPNLRIIATTTESLEIKGEEVWRIPSLVVPQSNSIKLDDFEKFSAVKLFVERARSVATDFTLSEENSDAVCDIVRRLDGLPLAIELAAARVKVLSPDQINQKLNKRFKLLTKGSRDATDRQKTLRKTIDWSYDLLSSDERTLLNRMSVFSEGFTLESSTAIATGDFEFKLDDKVLADSISEDAETFDDDFCEFDEFEILDLIDGLHSKSLIVTNKTAKGETRYYLLNTIREYAKEKLVESGEYEFIRKRYLRWFATWVNTNRNNLRGKDQALWLARFESENKNVLSAIDFAFESNQDGYLIILTSSMCIFWNVMGYHRLGLEKTKQAIERINIKSKTAGSLCLNSGVFAHWLGDFDEAIRVTNKSIGILEEIDAQDSLLFSYQNLAIYYQGNGNIDKSFELYEKTIKLSTELKQYHMLATSQMNLGLSYFDVGRYDDALRELKTSLASFEKISDYRMICWTNRLISSIHIDRLNLKEAERFISEAMKYGGKSGVNLEIILTLRKKAQFNVLIGKYDEAIECNNKIKQLSKKQLQDLGMDYYYDSSIEIYMSMNDMEKTKYYLEKLGHLKEDEKFGYRENDISILLTLAKYYIFNRELNNAKLIFDKIDERKKVLTKSSFINRYMLYKGMYLHLKNDFMESTECLLGVLKNHMESKSMLQVIVSLEFLSMSFGNMKKYKEASLIIGKAIQLRNKFGVPNDPLIKPYIDEIIANLSEFSGATFEKYGDRGANMSLDEIIEFISQ